MIDRTSIRIISLLWKGKKALHLREISRELKASTETIHRTCKRLAKDTYLKGQTKGKLKLYDLNFTNPLVEKLCELTEVHNTQEFFRKCPNYKPILTDMVEKLENLTCFSAAILYGSTARGEATEKSDIDILILLAVEKEKLNDVKDRVSRICTSLHYRHGRDFAPLVMTVQDFREIIKERKELVKRIFKEGRVLSGAELYCKEVFKVLEGQKWIE